MTLRTLAHFPSGSSCFSSSAFCPSAERRSGPSSGKETPVLLGLRTSILKAESVVGITVFYNATEYDGMESDQTILISAFHYFILT